MNLPDSFSVDDASVFWRGLHVPDTAAIDCLAAIPFPGGGDWVPIEGAEDAIAGGEPLIWQAPDRASAHANVRFFSDLRVIDVTALEGVMEIGVAKPDLLQAWPASLILRFLILSGIVRTFVHVEAELQLRKRVAGAARHVETYDASHVYYTNEENRASYGFGLALTFGSGRLEVMPT